MSRAEQLKWQGRYQSQEECRPGAVSPWLLRCLPKVKPGKALDLGMGLGSNALHLASSGFDVYGIDISWQAVRVAKDRARVLNLGLSGLAADLDFYPLKPSHYDLVIDFFYLNRKLYAEIKACLTRGGYLIFETYVKDGQNASKVNPSFQLDPGELLRAFQEFRVIAYEEDQPFELKEGPAKKTARVFAQKLT